MGRRRKDGRVQWLVAVPCHDVEKTSIRVAAAEKGMRIGDWLREAAMAACSEVRR